MFKKKEQRKIQIINESGPNLFSFFVVYGILHGKTKQLMEALPMKTRVMCVDDDLPILDSFQRFPWAAYGCELVGVAADGREGLDKLDALRPDILLVDIVMPRVDGLEFVRLAREKLENAVFIILSAHCDFEYARRAMRYGVNDYLTKGEYTNEELGALLLKFSVDGKEGAPYRFEVSEAIRLMNEMLKTDVTLEQVALKVGLSPNYLGGLFYQQTGERFRDCLIRLRMERARELIVHSPLKIYEVAQQVGIQNSQYFTYLYQKTYGETPAQARRGSP